MRPEAVHSCPTKDCFGGGKGLTQCKRMNGTGAGGTISAERLRITVIDEDVKLKSSVMGR